MDATEKKQNALAALPAVQSMATTYGLSPEQLVYTFKAIAMPASHSDAEFVACCLVAREHGLNPLTKEIYFMKTKSGTIQPIVSVDGWVRKCNEHPMFDGMEIFDVLLKAVAIVVTIPATWAVGLLLIVFGSKKRTMLLGGLLTLPLTLLLMGVWLVFLR